MAPTPMTATVVFGIPHLRQAIFAYHAQLIEKRRNEVLGAIPRPGSEAFVSRLSYRSYTGQRIYEYFAGTRLFLRCATNLMRIVGHLGMDEANWVDVLLSQPRNVLLWLVACTSSDRSRAHNRWLFEAHPKSFQAAGVAYEHPAANPAEMFYYLITQSGYSRSHELPPANEHSRASFVRDSYGRVFVLEVLERPGKQFLLEVASRCPRLLYADDSPFWPVYDAFFYDDDPGAEVGAVIVQMPPCALSRCLSPGNKRQDELRRILEQARDLFSHLAILHKHGISIGKHVDRDWEHALAHDYWANRQGGPWLLPAYLERTAGWTGTVARFGCYQEKLPPPPADAWPGDAEELRGLPWSQYAAYYDPRVPGPKFYLHGLAHADWNDEAFNERVAQLRAAAAKARATQKRSWKPITTSHWEPEVLSKVVPVHRFHEDVVMAAEQILDCFSQGCGGVDNDSGEVLKLLETLHPSNAYESTLRLPLAAFHDSLDCGRSPLFLYCPKCAKDHSGSYLAHGAPGDKNSSGLCTRCQSARLITAMPEAVRHLLVRILRPSYDLHGRMIVVTAQEALDTLENCLQTELPHLQEIYDRWARVRKRVGRHERPRDFPLREVLMDPNHQRWLLIENLRGNFLNEDLGGADLNKTRDYIRNQLTEVQHRKRDELRVICGGAAATSGASTSMASPAAAQEAQKQQQEDEEQVEMATSSLTSPARTGSGEDSIAANGNAKRGSETELACTEAAASVVKKSRK